MSLRNLRILALLILALSIASYGQSLGDVARETRAEHQKNGAVRTKVFTNDDVVHEPEAAPEKASKDEVKDAPNSAPADQSASPGKDEPKTAKTGERPPKKPVNEREERELETEKRAQELNRVYVDRILTLRKQFDAAQLELVKLQQAQADNTYEFRRTVGLSPYPSEYAAQQNTFNEKIEVQRSLMKSLTSQLADAQEAARHAGVLHADDY
jgi:hypothetical protein